MAEKTNFIDGSFAATGTSTDTLQLPPVDSGEVNACSLMLLGTWVGTVKLEARRGADAFREVASYDETDNGLHALPYAGNYELRLNCTAYTSGTLFYDLGLQ